MVPMVLISLLLMVVVSLLTRKPGQQTLIRYFPRAEESNHRRGAGQCLVASATNSVLTDHNGEELVPRVVFSVCGLIK